LIKYGKLDNSPLGAIWIAISDDGLKAVEIGGDGQAFAASFAGSAVDPGTVRQDDDVIAPVANQLREYFEGQRRRFEMEIDWGQLSEFQDSALKLAFEIPFGEVRTYGQLAADLGRSATSARAVGRAMATNPISIIIPCHRVIGADGELKGYGGLGGIRTKAWLLAFERHVASGQQPMEFQAVEQMRLPW
jgi:methylated-DNA-[protein]-cysteine S-methyltransferase